jgi:hypothetical protein
VVRSIGSFVGALARVAVMSAAAFARPQDLAQSQAALCDRIAVWSRAGHPVGGALWTDAVAASFALETKIAAERREVADNLLYIQALDNLADVIDAEVERLREAEDDDDV